MVFLPDRAKLLELAERRQRSRGSELQECCFCRPEPAVNGSGRQTGAANGSPAGRLPSEPQPAACGTYSGSERKCGANLPQKSWGPTTSEISTSKHRRSNT